MTTIAYKAGKLAADTLIQSDGTRIGYVTKIFRVPEGIAGASGSSIHAAAFIRWLDGREGNCPLVGLDETAKTNGMVIHHDGRLETFSSQGSWFAQPIAGCFALGSGCEYAEGAMAAGASAEEAVKIAIIFDCHSGGDVDVLELQQPAVEPEEEDGAEELDVLHPADLAAFAPMRDALADKWRTDRGLG